MNPQTNNQPTGNQNLFFGEKVSIPGINVNNAADNELIMQDNYSTRVYYNTSGIATVLLGTRLANSNNGIGTSQQGFYVSENGIDVRNATDSQLIFNSSQNVFKIVDVINIPNNFTAASSGNAKNYTAQYAHGLSYTPAYMAFLSLSSSLFTGVSPSSTNLPNPYTITGLSGGNVIVAGVAYVSVDATNIYFSILLDSIGGTYDNTATVYLLQETF